jgi:hypothetical protein
MHLRKVVSCPVVLGLVSLFPLVSGCSKPIEPQAVPLAHDRIQKLASICRDFAVSQKRQPANVDELKAWAKKLPKDKLAVLGIENVDEAFVSPRDQQPYVLVRGGPQMMIQAHEKTGEGGKRYVVYTTGSVFEMADKAFNELMSNPR